MALFKENISKNGIVSKYHKVSKVLVKDEQLRCTVDSYASKEYRDNDCAPVDSNVYRFTCTLEEEENNGIRKLCYAKLKELEEWKDSEDC